MEIDKSIDVDASIECMKEALKLPSPENVIKEEKLDIAIDLYLASLFEMSDNACFIMLVTVLEALTPGYLISLTAKEVLDSAKKLVKKERNKCSKDSDEWRDINHFLSRMGNLKYQSIGKDIEMYSKDLTKIYGDLGNPKEISAKLRDIYNIRSRFLHDGKFDEEKINEGLSFLKEFIPQLLEKLYSSEARKP